MARKKQPAPPILPQHPLGRVIAENSIKFPTAQLYTWFIDGLLEGFNVLKIEPIPSEAKEAVENITQCYLKLVRERDVFCDVLGPARISLSPYWPVDENVLPFTPQPVADLIADSKIALHNTLQPANTTPSIYDPTCGSGTVLLSMMRALLKYEATSNINHWNVKATDRDLLSVKACALQFLINAAIFGVGPGHFQASVSMIAKDRHTDRLIAEMKYFEATGQHELVKPGQSLAGSAQKILF